MKNYASILKSKTTLNPQHILEIGSGHGRDAEELALELKVPLSNVHIIEANPIAHDNIKKSYPEMNVYNCAVGSESKELTFWVHDYWPEISSLRRRADNIDSNSTAVTVKGIRGDDFLTQQGDLTFEACKLDVEGCSYEVLQGLGGKLNHIKSFHIECENYEIWKGQKDVNEISKFLSSSGYIQLWHVTTPSQTDAIWVLKEFVNKGEMRL